MTKKRTLILIFLHILLIFIAIPYGFISWLFGITPHVYTDPMYWLNLIALSAYALSALFVIILSMSKANVSPRLLYLPFIFLCVSLISLSYFLIKY